MSAAKKLKRKSDEFYSSADSEPKRKKLNDKVSFQ